MLYDLFSEQDICLAMQRNTIFILLANYEQSKYYKQNREAMAEKIKQEALYLSRHYSGHAFFGQYNVKKFDDGAFDSAAKYEYYPRIYLFIRSNIIATAVNVEQVWELESKLREQIKRILLYQYRKMYDLDKAIPIRDYNKMLKQQKGLLQ